VSGGTAVAADEQATPEGPVTLPWPRAATERARRSATRAWPAVAVYLAIRAVSTAVFAILSAGHGFAQRGLFVFVDSGWYRLIAEHGYDTRIAKFGSPFPFFPLYPGLMRLGHDVTGLSVDVVGVAITWIAAAACAWALFELGRLLRDARTGVIFAALWALLPSAVIEGASYADTLAVSLSAWALYALLRRWWIAAAVLACLAGLTRPTANALVATVCLAALIELVKRRGRAGARVWAALVVPPLGAIGYLAYVAHRMGSLTGYLKAQKQWGTGFSNVQNVFHRIHEGMLGTSAGYQNYPTLITTAVLLAVPVLIVLLILQRVPWPLICYTVVLAALVYASIHVYTVVPREFLALFPLLLPVASALAKVERRAAVYVVLGTLAVAAGWYACYIPINAGGSIP
jgi:Gpi18-like mannosyltransferase